MVGRTGALGLISFPLNVPKFFDSLGVRAVSLRMSIQQGANRTGVQSTPREYSSSDFSTISPAYAPTASQNFGRSSVAPNLTEFTHSTLFRDAVLICSHLSNTA
jgi:hypothetical protein